MQSGAAMTGSAVDSGEPTAVHQVRGGGGLRLHVRQWGNRDGPPLLFIHGWSQSQLCWARQTNGPLAQRFHLVAFDNRGHGMSEKPPDLTPEAALTAWRSPEHTALVERIPGLVRYVQNSVVSSLGAPVCDGIGELWFRDDQALHAALSSPELAAASEDATRFLDMQATGLVILDEQDVIT